MLTFLKIGKAVNGLEDTLRHTFGDHKDFNKLLVAERELIFRRPEPLNHWKKRRSTLQGMMGMMMILAIFLFPLWSSVITRSISLV